VVECVQMLAAIDYEVRSRLFTMRCPEHFCAPVVELLVGEIGAIQIISLGCCGKFDAMVLKALQSSAILEPLCLPGLAPPRTPILPPPARLGREKSLAKKKSKSRH
jgi:hypothetical protein